MTEEKTVVVELCRSNSIGDRFYEASTIEWWRVSREEAERLVNEKRPNGYFVRIVE